MDRHFHINTSASGQCSVVGANDGLTYAEDIGVTDPEQWRRGVEVALQIFGATFSRAPMKESK